MRHILWIVLLILPAMAVAGERPTDSPFLNLLWLVHTSGTPEAALPHNDVPTKARIVAAQRRGKTLTQQTAEGLMAKETFTQLEAHKKALQ